jgi:hypothetical protein
MSAVTATVAVIAAVAATAGTLMAAQAQSKNQKAMANAAEAQAEIQRQQAERERQITAAQEADYRREEARNMATLRARLGGAGVTTEGTPLLVMEDISAETELQALRIRSIGDTNAIRMEQGAVLSDYEATNLRSQAKSTMRTGYVSAIGAGASTYAAASGGKRASLITSRESIYDPYGGR